VSAAPGIADEFHEFQTSADLARRWFADHGTAEPAWPRGLVDARYALAGHAANGACHADNLTELMDLHRRQPVRDPYTPDR